MNMAQWQADVDEYNQAVQQPLYDEYSKASDKDRAVIYCNVIKNWLDYMRELSDAREE